MSVLVVTGQFGSGKTSLVVDMLANDPQFQGRPLFTMGIDELKLDHQPVPPVSEWVEERAALEDETKLMWYFRFPPNAVIVIDEAQRIFRPRPVGSKVPPEVQAFETHRHTGIDIILITQHANLLDSALRQHKPRHIHIRNTFLGAYKYEWLELGDPDKQSDRETANRSRYKPNKRVFDLYKSSVQHTKIKVKTPWFVYLFGVAAIAAAGTGYYAYTRIVSKSQSPDMKTLSNNGAKGPASASVPGQTSKSLDTWLEESSPRNMALAHTAPRYDQITAPTDAPWPQACLISKYFDREQGKHVDKCGCIDQQGNRYRTTDSQCRDIAMNGLFKDWGSQQVKEQPKRLEDRATGTAQPAPANTLPPSQPFIAAQPRNEA